MARGNYRDRGYDARWEKLRRIHLTKNPVCVPCQAEGRLTPADTVDHTHAWQSGATEEEQQLLKYDEKNLTSMCRSHHSKKTALEDGSFGRPRVQGPRLR